MKELIRIRVQYASRQQCCKTHKRPLPFTFVFSNFWFKEILAVYDILYSRTGHRWQYGACALHAGYLRLQTHSEYVILIAFPLQKWFKETSQHQNYLTCNIHWLSSSFLLPTVQPKRSVPLTLWIYHVPTACCTCCRSVRTFNSVNTDCQLSHKANHESRHVWSYRWASWRHVLRPSRTVACCGVHQSACCTNGRFYLSVFRIELSSFIFSM